MRTSAARDEKSAWPSWPSSTGGRCDAGETKRIPVATCQDPAVSSKPLAITAIVLLVDAALLLIVGASMWGDAASPADRAVGKGLVTLGVAVGIPTVVVFCAFLRSMPRRAPEPARNDWDSV